MSFHALFAVLLMLPQPDQPISPIAIEDRLYMSYIDLLEPAMYSPQAFRALRSKVKNERDEKIDAARKTERQWKKELNEARSELEEINKGPSVDTPGVRARRAQLHIDISALERGIPEKKIEHEVRIPAEYDKLLAKLWLMEHWPEEREEILHRIDEGESRQRLHGDVEDIGFRRIARDPEDDIEPGRQASRQMIASGWLPPELQDETVQSYVRQVADRIAASSDLKVPLHVAVVDSTSLRIVALPGGYLYVSSSALLAAHTESEFAGILAREIARIAARHEARASKRSLVSKVFMPIAQIAAGIFTPGLNRAASYGVGYGMQGLGGIVEHVTDGSTAKYQKEADQLGVQYAWKAGFDPRGSIESLDSMEGNAAPALRLRLLNLFGEIEYLPPQPNPITDSPEFRAIRARLRHK